MCEVSRRNFSQLFPKLQQSLAAADIVALDFEFSGIDLEPNSLFDTARDRYAKSRSSARRTTVLQCGLALFTSVTDGPRHNTYSVEAFNFLLFPPAYPPLKNSFVCQSDALQFLRSHSFDLNACVKNGVSFLNDNEIAHLRRHLADLERCDFLRSDLEREVRARAAEVAEWLSSERPTASVAAIPGLHSNLLEVELRFRFPEIWTSTDGEQNEVRVSRVSPEDRLELEENERKMTPDCTKNAFLLDLMGFTRIIRTIINLKKPVVAHNAFMDMLMLYEKFLRPLPSDLLVFKTELVRLLPDIYDTRCIVTDFRKCQPDLASVLGDASVLEDIFACLKAEMSANQDLSLSLPPHFVLSSESSRYNSGSFSHEAGYDAMMAGCVLIMIGHRAAFPPTPNRPLLRPGEVNFEAYRRVLAPFSCRLNVIQAGFDWLDLRGKDYAQGKPPRLMITAKGKEKVDVEELKSLADSFGRNDIMAFGHGALVQFNSFGGFWALRRELRGDGTLVGEPFSPLRHRPAVRRALLASAIGATFASAAAVTSLLIESAVLTAVTVVKPM